MWREATSIAINASRNCVFTPFIRLVLRGSVFASQIHLTKEEEHEQERRKVAMGYPHLAPTVPSCRTQAKKRKLEKPTHTHKRPGIKQKIRDILCRKLIRGYTRHDRLRLKNKAHSRKSWVGKKVINKPTTKKKRKSKAAIETTTPRRAGRSNRAETGHGR